MGKVVFKQSPLAIKPTGKKYPIIPMRLDNNGIRSSFPFQSIVDTGADKCLFSADLGEDINLDIKSVKPVRVGGAGKDNIYAYYHAVDLVFDFDGIEFKYQTQVGFVDAGMVAEMGIGLLGRDGFLDKIESLRFVQKKELFEIEYELPC